MTKDHVDPRGAGRAKAQPIRRSFEHPLAAIGPVAVIAIALIWDGDPWSQLAITGAIVVLAVALAINPGALGSFVPSAELAGIKLNFASPPPPDRDEVEEAGQGDGEGPGLPLSEVDARDEWLEVRWALERRLTYLAKHTLPDHLDLVRDVPRGELRPYLSVGSLVYDKLLTPEDAQVATLVLSLSVADLASVREGDRDRLLRDGAALSKVLRLRVFGALVGQFMQARGFRCISHRGKVATYHRDADGARVDIRPAFSSAGGSIAKGCAVAMLDDGRPRAIVVPMWPDPKKNHVVGVEGVSIVPLGLLDGWLDERGLGSVAPPN